MKSKLVILDADVIINIFKYCKWTDITRHCSILLPQSIIDEIVFFDDCNNNRIPLNIELFADRDFRIIESVDAKRVIDAKKWIRDRLGKELHTEIEPILMVKDDSELSFCTADKAAIFVVGAFGLSDQAISFEKLMLSIGYTPPTFAKTGTWKESQFMSELKEGAKQFPVIHCDIIEL